MPARGARPRSQSASALRAAAPIAQLTHLARSVDSRSRGWRALWILRARELKHARLHAGVGFNLQRVIVHPRDAQTRRLAHDRRRSVALALFARGLVSCRVPAVGNLPSGGIEWDVGVVSFRRRDHAPSPVFTDDRDPVAREIDGRGCSWSGRRSAAAASTLRWLCGRGHRNAQSAGNVERPRLAMSHERVIQRPRVEAEQHASRPSTSLAPA